MFVERYYTQTEDTFSFSREQASDFAKSIAGDFNPIHDPDNKRFCVPGDLLFSLTLSKYGVSKAMSFNFQGMVGSDTPVHFVEEGSQVSIQNEKEKTFLTVDRTGDVSVNEAFIEGLIRSYVAFSGKTFPHILVELMEEEGMMLNAERPMVIYDLMKIEFTSFAETAPEVVLQSKRFDVDGKRGMVIMNFDIQADGKSIGSGEKHIIMSGLRPYEQSGIDMLVNNYEEAKARYFEN
ncbi:DUF3581 family protein [Aliikangiella sp. G2MR2-5]|uniref:DUF3581 family protein n=1 Tax=Aliikangiella sp. G2MR2-5 TaxID=2788943 RepID=UPI0018AA0471|nr:DUF3581 family protein [Aliikangiella sp. G2MR2-5]